MSNLSSTPWVVVLCQCFCWRSNMSHVCFSHLCYQRLVALIASEGRSRKDAALSPPRPLVFIPVCTTNHCSLLWQVYLFYRALLCLLCIFVTTLHDSGCDTTFFFLGYIVDHKISIQTGRRFTWPQLQMCTFADTYLWMVLTPTINSLLCEISYVNED